MLYFKSLVVSVVFSVMLLGSVLIMESVIGEENIGEGNKWATQVLENGNVRITVDGTFFAEYRINYKGTPIIWPICSANGLLMTRGYPMIEDENIDQESSTELKNILLNAKVALNGEAKDHPHHRSFWFNHGDVDGRDFWALDKNTAIVHDSFSAIERGKDSVLLKCRNKWVDRTVNKTLCTDERTIRFGLLDINGKKARVIDFDIVIFASEGDVRFNDTKEGTFGCRVPGTMDLTAKKRNSKQGLSKSTWGGMIVNSNGDKDDDAWSKRADWVDYTGPVPVRLNKENLDSYFAQTDKTRFDTTEAGIIIMNHPKSFRYPSWWHVRNYGLFTANPFGQKEFEKGKDDGSVLLKKGETMTFGYRVVFHDGAIAPAVIDQLYKIYTEVHK